MLLSQVINPRGEATYNWNEIVSRGEAETCGGSKVVPFAPTFTVMTLPCRDAGVGAGEPGYEEYVVVQPLVDKDTACVTRVAAGAAGIVTPP